MPTRIHPLQLAQAVACSPQGATPLTVARLVPSQARHLAHYRDAVVARMVADTDDRSRARMAEQTTGAVPAAAAAAASLAGAAGAAAAGEETPHTRLGPRNAVVVTHTGRAVACAQVPGRAGAGRPHGVVPSAIQAPETAPTEQPKGDSARHGRHSRGPRERSDHQAGPSHRFARWVRRQEAPARPGRPAHRAGQARHLEVAASGSLALGAAEPPLQLLPHSPPRLARPGPRKNRGAMPHHQWASRHHHRLRHPCGPSQGRPRRGPSAAARRQQKGVVRHPPVQAQGAQTPRRPLLAPTDRRTTIGNDSKRCTVGLSRQRQKEPPQWRRLPTGKTSI